MARLFSYITRTSANPFAEVRSRLSAEKTRWNSWRQLSANRKIFSAMLTISAVTVVVKVITTAKELVTAAQFGTSDALDAFLIAYLIPSFAMNIVTGCINAALMPTYIKLHEQQGEKAAQRLYSNTLTLSLTLLLSASVLLAATSPYYLPLIASGFNSAKLDLTRNLLYAVLPILVISGMTATWGAVLNAGERFARVALAPIVIPLLTIVILLAFGGTWGIYALVLATIAGHVSEAFVISRGMRQRNLSILPRWSGLDPNVKHVMKQYGPLAAGTILMSGASLVDQAMAAMLSGGSVSALNYGGKVVSVLVGVGSTALSTAIFPHFSRMIADQSWALIRHTLRTYCRLILKISIPTTLVLVVFSRPLVQLLFERGAFTAADTDLVAAIQRYSLLQVPFYVLSILGVRLLTAAGQNKTIAFLSGINLIVNVAGNYILMQYLGVAGISLSTTLVYAGSTILIFFALRLEMKKWKT